MSTKRLSNIELLRVGAIIMIVMMHGIGYALHSPNDINRIGVTAINTLGNMGVTTFMLISGYFGIHFKWSRLSLLWMTALFYSIISFVVNTAYNSMDYTLLYKAFTPVTSMTWWFLSWYIVIFCLSPYLNKAAEYLTRLQMITLLGILFSFFVLSPSLLFHPMTNDMGGKGLPNMITAYLIGQYIAKYDLPKWFTTHSGKLLVAASAIVFTGSYAAGCISLSASNIMCKDNNLFVVIGATALFCWTRKYTFRSSVINYIAGFSFPIYLVNGDALKFLSPWYVGDVNCTSIWMPYLLAILATVMTALVLETVRRLLFGRLNAFLAQRFEVLILNIYENKMNNGKNCA